MLEPVRCTTTVQPGGMVHISAGNLPAGTTAEVIIMPVNRSSPLPRLVDGVGSATGVYASPAEADAFLRAERNQWSS